MSAGINYNQLNVDRTNMMAEQFQARLAKQGTGGGPDTLRHMVLTHIITGNYERAISELERFTDENSREFPIFTTRASRYINHCHDLIAAIKSKKEFPGFASLQVAKQQEMFEKVLDHFDELKDHLKRVEAINMEIQLDDIRSTVYVVKTLSMCVGVLMALGFTLELIESLFGSYDLVLTDVAKSFSDWLFDFNNF